MNKKELASLTKIPVNGITSIFQSLDLSDLTEFDDEHLQTLQRIQQLYEQHDCRSWKEAVGYYLKPQRQLQLEQLAEGYGISGAQVADILASLNVDLMTLTEQQRSSFTQVCQELQSGLELSQAVGSVVANSIQIPFVEDASTALTVAPPSNLRVLPLPEQQRASMREVAVAVAQEVNLDINRTIAEEALAISDQVGQVSRELLYEQLFAQQQPLNPDAAVDYYRKLRGEVNE